MAGSYGHLCGGFSLVEHMGDATDAMHELMWLVERDIGRERAEQLLRDEYYPMIQGKREPDAAYLLVERLSEE